MKLAFRVDASIDIGTGHVMRCLTLADALRARDVDSRFICRPHCGHLMEEVGRRGYAVHALPDTVDQLSSAPAGRVAGPEHANWLGCDWLTDAQQTVEVLAANPVDWLVVDHYVLDVRWEGRLRPFCGRLLAIDDLADRAHDCDLLLDQNLGRLADDYARYLTPECRLLIGPRYALLRPEFAALRADSLARRAIARPTRLLISMGGVDKEDATSTVLDALRGAALPADSRITVLLGPHAPWKSRVSEFARKLQWPTEVLVNVGNIAQLMADSDLAIGAAGTTAWERCCLGLPTLTLVLGDNQRSGASALQAAGAVVLLAIGIDFAAHLHAALRTLQNQTMLRDMQAACAAITDGNGAERLVTELFRAHPDPLSTTFPLRQAL